MTGSESLYICTLYVPNNNKKKITANTHTSHKRIYETKTIETITENELQSTQHHITYVNRKREVRLFFEKFYKFKDNNNRKIRKKTQRGSQVTLIIVKATGLFFLAISLLRLETINSLNIV